LSWFIFDCSRKKQSQFVFNRPGRKLKSPLATHTPSIWTRRKNRENFVDATASNCQTACVKTVEQSFVFGHPTLSQYYCWASQSTQQRRKNMKKYGAEFFGTFWLVLGGCGSAVLAAAFPNVGIGLLGVALAFGLTVLTMAFAIGHISGCHLNPAVSLGLWAGGRFPAKELLPYIVAQVLGGIAAGGVLYLIASGKTGFDVSAGFASNGYGAHSPGGYGMLSALVTEVVMTMMFLLVILGATDKRAPQGFAPIAIGLCLTLIHLISIPVTNTSVNPARSTGVAVFVGGWAISQLWLFWVAPIMGGIIGAVIYRFIGSEEN
jgi:aquaporin Z